MTADKEVALAFAHSLMLFGDHSRECAEKRDGHCYCGFSATLRRAQRFVILTGELKEIVEEMGIVND